ncbi:SDR family oxidoreductase [Asticcacaulis sp. AND118]|uniref:SDR family oxidoreductase n=1 Tax=Asticcacaulis sp. AND118 TaxID=2840468 RepID=UPI001CFF5ADC|nr:SDR family oxidoreductase [Asticcacaulis sp. AND118]UDF04978.1 SDR family oxidoreductase [Asticcacaulis sp. AND118]
MSELWLEDKCVLVTGAAKNLGRAFAENAGRRGARVVVHYHDSNSAAEANAAVEQIRGFGAQAVAVQADLTQADAVIGLMKTTIETYGRLDVLINNAGLIIKKPFGELELEDYDACFAVNARAPFLLMREAVRYLPDGGRVINIGTSILGLAFGGYGIYVGSKGALEHMTRVFAQEFKSRRITANLIAPGALDTPFFYGAESEHSVAMIKQFTGGLGAVEDISPMVDFLTSPQAGWITGQTLFVNGGFVAR